ncbi:MAG: hypothetical protein HOV83_26885, partial [Catenulispora sp.]|nr:hypothetical protein [Catenulispora sp.]
MEVRTSAPVRPEADGTGAPGRRRATHPAPGLWPASAPLRIGAAVLIAGVLGGGLLLAVRPWETDDGFHSYDPYGESSAVHG